MQPTKMTCCHVLVTLNTSMNMYEIAVLSSSSVSEAYYKARKLPGVVIATVFWLPAESTSGRTFFYEKV